MKKKAQVKHHVPEWTFIGAAIVLSTMACSFSLPDISNLPRLAILALALAVTLLCTARLGTRIPKSLGAAAFVGFILLTAASTCWAVNKGEALYDTARWIAAGALFLVLYNLHRRHPARTTVMLARVAAVIIIPSLAMAAWQTLQLEGDLVWDNRYSITAFYTHKGTFSLLLLACCLPVAMRVTLGLGRWEPFYRLLLVLVATTLLFLAARTTFIALAAFATVLLLTFIPFRPVARKWHIPMTVAMALLLGVVTVGGSRLFCRLPLGDTPGEAGGVLSSATIFERHTLWNTTFRLVDKQPMLGVGAGNWKVCYPEVSTRDIFSVDVLDFTFVRPHNDYLRVLSETGYIGLALLLLALASPMVRAIGHTSRRRRTGRMTGIVLAFTAASLVAAFVDFPLDRTELLLWHTLTFALLAASQPPKHWVSRTVNLVFAVLLVGVFALSLVRIGSEKQYPRITAANHARMWNTMEEAAHAARSPLCSLTPIGTPFAYYEAMAQEQLGKPALETFAQALHDSPCHKQSLNDLARLIYTSSHNADSAEALFKKAIFVSPSFSYAYFNLAQLYLQEGKKEEAQQALLNLDLDQKQQRIDRLIWHYHTGETALYYSHQLVPAERQFRDQLLAFCERTQ